jgi:glycosyltransferase involved in cell wall biosynthesis
MSLEKNNKKRKVLVLCPHPVGYAPGQRLRYEQYLDSFRDAGYVVDVSPFMTEKFQKMVYSTGRIPEKFFWTFIGYVKRFFTLFTLRQYDVIYIFLWVTPFGFPVFEWIVKLFSRKLIYDIDDLIYSKSRSKANPIISGIKGRSKPIYLFKKADHIITSTVTIEEFARQFNNQITNIPVTVDTVKYSPRTDYKIRNKITLGWSGSLSTSPYMHLLDEMLLELKKKLDFKLLILGDPYFSIPNVDVEALAWTEGNEVETIRQFDIGLYPLPDEQWILGKGGGKALQYMALGVPTVATAIGMNFKIIANDINGFLVNTSEEWIDAIIKLANDQQLRERIGKSGIETVEKSYSINANKKHYLSILDRMMKD